MEDSLPAIDAGVDDQTVTAPGDALVMCDLPCNREEVPHQWLIVHFQRAHGFDMPVRHNQNVRWRDGMDIAEGGGMFVSVDDLGFGFTGYDLAEDA